MSELWNEYLAPHPFDFELVRQSDTRYVFRVTQWEPVPAELPVIFGEWLYNLRSALDYIVWATAVHTSGSAPPPGEGGLQYPIYDEAAAWDKNLWRLKPLAGHHRHMLHTMQPFNSNADANFLGWINRLARIDRHRRTTVWTARLGQIEPVLQIPSGKMPRSEYGREVFVDGVCDFMRYTFASRQDAEGVSGNPRVGIDPEIAEWSVSPFWGRLRFSDRLRMMHVFVRAELGLYEYDCTGESEAQSVSDGFRSEADARHASGFYPPVQTPVAEPIVWTPAKGRRSSESRYRGEDFPVHGPEGQEDKTEDQ
jgi:hypothetical protein